MNEQRLKAGALLHCSSFHRSGFIVFVFQGLSAVQKKNLK